MEYFFPVFLSLAGACYGSFINMLASRLPASEDIVFKPSHCRRCGYNLKFLDLIPVFSWLYLWGKCRKCGEPIGIRYFLVEVFLACLFPLIWWKYGNSAETLLLLYTSVVVTAMTVIDLEHYIIPDSLQLALIPAAILWVYINGSSFQESLLGLAALAVITLGLKLWYLKVRKKDALGWGDIKLLMICGFWLGIKDVTPLIFFSGVYGLLFGICWCRVMKISIFPFGPSILAGLMQSLLFPEINRLFWNLFENIFYQLS